MRIGPYEVLLELGRGGMGAVYLGRVVGAGGVERLVALKRAHTPALAEPQAHERFLQEARVTASVHHANVVGIHQVGEDEDGPYIVSDYVEGESLAGLVGAARSSGGIPRPIALRVILDALLGLHAAHETRDAEDRPLGILHRDVSPDNLLVGRDGVTRLSDFGIAKINQSSVVTGDGLIQGKLKFLPPEYLTGSPCDRTCDTYAMGVSLWMGLVGRLPFKACKDSALVVEILEQGVPSLASVGIDVGPRLTAFMARATHRDPGERFQTAHAMLEALDAAAAEECPPARAIEVAAYVEQVAGEALAARRAKAQTRRAELSRNAEPPSSLEVAAATRSARPSGVEPTRSEKLGEAASSRSVEPSAAELSHSVEPSASELPRKLEPSASELPRSVEPREPVLEPLPWAVQPARTRRSFRLAAAALLAMAFAGLGGAWFQRAQTRSRGPAPVAKPAAALAAERAVPTESVARSPAMGAEALPSIADAGTETAGEPLPEHAEASALRARAAGSRRRAAPARLAPAKHAPSGRAPGKAPELTPTGVDITLDNPYR